MAFSIQSFSTQGVNKRTIIFRKIFQKQGKLFPVNREKDRRKHNGKKITKVAGRMQTKVSPDCDIRAA